MVRFGNHPFLECSSKGDKQLSAFYANITINGVTASIEAFYQSYKKLGVKGVIDPNWRNNKGRLASYGASLQDCKNFYNELWNMYLDANPLIVEKLKQYNGFTDIFGREGNVCQAEEIYKYMSKYL